MFGIERIHIVNDLNIGRDFAERIDNSKKSESLFNSIYHSLLPISEGEGITEVNKTDLLATYDYREGIDVILTLENNARLTLQEKCLTTTFNTVTFETEKNSGVLGNYYTCTAQLYFVGYVNPDYTECLRYCLIDLARYKMIHAQGKIPCGYRQNQVGNHRQKFMYTEFKDIPQECIIAIKFGI